MGEGQSLLGPGLREARNAEGVGVRELGRRSGLDPGQISRIESGRVEQPEYRTLRSLARALGRSSLALEALARPDHDTGQALYGSISEGELWALRQGSGRWEVAEWAALGEALSADGYWERPLPPEVLSLARDFFVHVTIVDHLEEISQSAFADDLNEIEDLLSEWRGLSDDRRGLVLAYAAEQAALSELDRRGSNPQRIRLRVERVDGEKGR